MAVLHAPEAPRPKHHLLHVTILSGDRPRTEPVWDDAAARTWPVRACSKPGFAWPVSGALTLIDTYYITIAELCLLSDLHVAPEGDVVREVLFDDMDGGFFGRGVRPGVVFAPGVALADIEVLAFSFPGTGVGRRTFAQEFFFDR